MKWLRSSLFKDNNDKFVFEEKIDVDLTKLYTTIKNVKDVVVKGSLTRSGQDKIFVDLVITGIYEVESSRTLNILEVPFEIEEQEEFIDKAALYEGSIDYDINLMDMYIDIAPLVNELIILNSPTTYYLEDETVESSSGKDWQLISDEDYVEEEKKDNPFSALSDMFKEK